MNEDVLIDLRDAVRELLAEMRQRSTRTTDNGELISLNDLARLLGVGRSKAERLRAAGELLAPVASK